MLPTALCDDLGIDIPIILAPMGPTIGTPELAAAVSNAGGLGVISFGGFPVPALRDRIAQVRKLTDRPFGINVILDNRLELPFDRSEAVATCIEERVPVLSLSFGDPAPWVERAHAAGIKVMHQVGTVEEARRAADAGVDIIVAQGVEAGGHLAGEITTLALVPRVVDAVAPVPVAAAGGIADGRGLVAVLALGAGAAMIGTRFIATPEAGAHPIFKQAVLAATEADTVPTTLFGVGWPDAPHRVVRTPFVDRWMSASPDQRHRVANGTVIGTTRFGGEPAAIPQFGALPPDMTTEGDFEAMCFLAGGGVGLVNTITPAAEVVRWILDDARQVSLAIATTPASANPGEVALEAIG